MKGGKGRSQGLSVLEMLWINVNRQRSYYKWGLQEIQRRIDTKCNVGYTEYEVICEFVHQMEELACLNPINSIMFSCAADAGKYVLDGFTPVYM